MKVITISHSHAEGTLISGTSRGDGSAEVLKSMDNPYTARAAWRWSRNLGAWYVQRSRDARANTALIDATKTALEAKGFSVAVEIDDTYRSAAEVEADKIARQEDRVTALQAKAERKSAAAEAAWEAERRAVESLPEGGEPIHVGHHSEKRHRNAINKANKATRRAIDSSNEAAEVADRAESAAHTTEVRYAPGVIRRRIARMEAELRRHERTRDGHTRTLFTDSRGIKHVDTFEAATGAHRERVLAEITRLQDQIIYWKHELEQAAASGAQLWSADTVLVGDQVRYWSSCWDTVARVSAKSIGLTQRRSRLPYDQINEIRDHQSRHVRIVDGARCTEDPDPGGD
ncbi:hypothetical protein AOT88_21520 [Mycobacteroides sp. H063]|nr:hypothetical protein AOT88_21520 [Mycobacteroides sp. H063]